MNNMRRLELRYYKPQPDITAWEVAQMLDLVTRFSRRGGVMFTDDSWNALAPELKRHFSETRPT